MNSIKYDLYTTDDAVTPVAVDIVSGYQHNMSGDETTKTFYVKGYNVLGDNIDSNQDDGNAITAVLTYTWEDLSSGSNVDTTPSAGVAKFEYSNNGGTSWFEQPGGMDQPINQGTGPYIIRELVPNTITSLKFGGNSPFNTRFLGAMTATGGSLETISSSFRGCTGLTSIDLTGLNFANVIDTRDAFNGCTNITCISNLDTTNSADKTSMFANTPALTQPDATAQADLQDTDGANWVNANPCP